MYNEHLKINNRETNGSSEKVKKLADKYMKRHSTSFDIGELQINNAHTHTHKFNVSTYLQNGKIQRTCLEFQSKTGGVGLDAAAAAPAAATALPKRSCIARVSSGDLRVLQGPAGKTGQRNT